VSDEEKKTEDEQEGEEEEKEKPTKLGKFIQTYSAFLSSFVIGVAGLIATSIWQYRQGEIARRQAEGQQRVAETQAANAWRVERAGILAKNLTLLTKGGGTVDQRYGVLLSLTRGKIVDPELAVSYALDLGLENPEYMKSVLAATDEKSWLQLMNAFQLTCMQRFGVARDLEVCKADKLADRSQAIAEALATDLERGTRPSPLELLADDRTVEGSPGKLSWLFEPYVTDLYERRQWHALQAFERSSAGARLVAAIVLATSRTGEFVSRDESVELDKIHAERRKHIASYLLGPQCDPECKGKLVDVMLSLWGEAQGDFDEPLGKLMERPRNESGPALARVHQRLLWCQIDAGDLELLRDKVLVPRLVEVIARPKADPALIADLASLLAVAPDPTADKAKLAHRDALSALQKANPDVYRKSFINRRVIADRERRDPPPAARKLNFCQAGAQVVMPSLPE
jgi:hypothetical protein